MRARRTDANHADMVEEFRRLGASVLDLSRMGEGAPDLLIAFGGLCMLVEVKNPKKPPSARKLTPDQVDFWNGWKANPRIVMTKQDCQAAVTVLETWLEKLT